MEPMHIYALLHLRMVEEEMAEEARRDRLEQYFVTRDHSRLVRGERIRRMGRRIVGWRAPSPPAELAV